MDSQPSIDVYGETIGNIFRTEKLRLRVPINQRSYAWKKEHVSDLYGDLAAAIADQREEYFLGSIVVVRVNDRTEVYDGQQRLATSMILVAAIRDYFLESGDEKTAGIIEMQSLFSEDRETHEENCHFRLNAEDQDFFFKRVLLRPKSADRIAAKKTALKTSHKLINDAAALAAKHVNGIVQALPEPARGKQLHRWLDFLEKGARVIWVQVGDERTAFTIFETMNDRGLKLSSADLLKNCIYATAEDRKEEAIQKWQAMCAVLESVEGEEEGIVDYIRSFWITRHGFTRSKELYDKIKFDITNKTKAVTLASELETSAHDYAALLTSSHDAWANQRPGMRTKVAILRSLGVTQIRPLLLAALKLFPPGQMDKLFDLCICWSVRCLITGVPSGTLERHYSRNALDIYKGNIKNLAELTDVMVKIVPDDQRFLAAAETAYVAKPALARFYLRKLQLQDDGIKEPEYIPNDGNEVTLEHILPEVLGPGWGHFTPEQAATSFHRLGNQALLIGTVNGKIGNVGYDLKKPALLASEFSLTKEAAKFSRWGVDEITERQKRLAELAILAWPIRK